LYNDGYWFAAQFLRDWQPELLNGIRYADVFFDRGTVELQLCFFLSLYCETLMASR
jgi:hypothetical protein